MGMNGGGRGGGKEGVERDAGSVWMVGHCDVLRPLTLVSICRCGCDEPADVPCPVLVGVRKLAVGLASHCGVVGEDGVGEGDGRGSGRRGG